MLASFRIISKAIKARTPSMGTLEMTRFRAERGKIHSMAARIPIPLPEMMVLILYLDVEIKWLRGTKISW